MFGFGLVEIAILLAIVILIFGAAKARKMVDSGLRVYREVEKTKREIRSAFSLGDIIPRKKNRK